MKPSSTIRKTFLAIGFVVLAVLMASMMISPARVRASQPLYGGTLVWGIRNEPELPGLLAAGAPTIWGQAVAQQMFNHLVANDFVTGKWIPELAQSWDISADHLQFTFHLVHNATWHDGQPFTSADVKYTYEEIAPVFGAEAANFMDAVSSIDTPDDYTLVINMKHPYPAMFIQQLGLGGMGMSIMPKHLYEGTDLATNPYNTKPIGTGPYMFKEWVTGDHITLVRNPNYWKKGLPYLDRMIYQIIPDTTAMALAFKKGDVDFVWAEGITPQDALAIQSDIASGKLTGKRVWFWPSADAAVDTLMLNQHPDGPDPWFRDVRVRKAIAYAVDMNRLNELAFLNTYIPVTGPVPPASSVAWYYQNDTRQPTYDPAMAEKLLDDAGYKRGSDGTRFKIRFVCRTDMLDMANVLKDYFEAVGIETAVTPLDFAAWSDAVFVKWDFDVYIYPMSTGPDPNYLKNNFSTEGIAHSPWSNSAGYSNPEVDAMFSAMAVEPDIVKRGELMKSIGRMLVNDQAAYWIICETFINALNLDFSDQFQPGAWENAAGTCVQRMERVYWLKGTAPTAPTTTAAATTAPTTAVSTATTEAVPGVGTESIILTVIAAIVIIGGIAFYLRRRPKRQRT